MISSQDIHELLDFKTGAPSIVSLYIELDAEGAHQRRCQALIAEALAREPLYAQFREDFSRIADFVAAAKPGGPPALAVFSSAREKLWRTVPLPEGFGSSLRVDRAPYLSPLSNILDQHQRYGVVLVTHDKARLLEVFLGQIEEQAFQPAGAAPGKGTGRIADPMNRHLRAVADETAAWARRRGLDRIILGAPPEVETHLLRHLNGQIQDNIIVDPQMSAEMPPEEILEKVLTGERESRKVRESVLVFRLLDAAKEPGAGVVGMAETLRALHNGSVRMLLVRRGLAKMGRFCPRCGALGLTGKKCVYCWLNTEPTLDLVSLMIESALEQNCSVFRIAYDSRLDTHGGVGAELSFAVAPAPPEAELKPPADLTLTTAPPSTKA